MPKSQTSELPEDPWDELLHQGDVFEESVRATPAIVDALARGTDDDQNWLYVLAAMCVGRPERLAEQIRVEARKGADLYRRNLSAAAIGVLAASGAASDDDRRRFAELARSADPEVAAPAVLALGLEQGHAHELRGLLGAETFAVRYAAALALAKLDAMDDVVARLLVAGVGGDEAEAVTARPPWDTLYDVPASAAAVDGTFADLLDRLDAEQDVIAAVDLVHAALGAARTDDERRKAARHILASDAVWQRERELEATLRQHELPGSRDDLGAWLGG